MKSLLRSTGIGVAASFLLLSSFLAPDSSAQNRDLHTERIVLDDAAGDGGFNTLMLRVPPSGLSANRTLTFPDADGSVVTLSAPLAVNQVLFGGSSGQAAQNVNLFWNNATEQLGAGTNTPSAKLHGLSLNVAVPAVRGDNVANGVGVAGISDLFGVQGQTNLGTGVFAVSVGTGTGLLAQSDVGVAASISNTNAANTNPVIAITNLGSATSMTVGAGTSGDAIEARGTVTTGADAGPIPGELVFHDNTAANTFTGTIRTSNALTANRTYTLPDASGTIAIVGSIVTDLTLTGDGSGGSPLGIDLTNANSWSGAQTFSSVDINGGTIDGTTIGATSPAAGTFTNVTTNGGSVTVNDGVNADLVITEGGVDRSSGGTEVFRVNNSGAGAMDLLVNGATQTINSRLTVSNGHWTSQQTTAPTATGDGTNFAAAVTVSANSTDVAGSVTATDFNAVGVGTISVSFNTAYAGTPYVVVTPANASAANSTFYVSNVTTTGFDINLVSTIGDNTSTYDFIYQVIEGN